MYQDILFANMWQLLISLSYIAFNALISCLMVAAEWAKYSGKRKPLRVSFPQGIQRSSFAVSMPLIYGIPLTVTMAVLHWAVSQSIFVVRVVSYWSDGSQDFDSTITAGNFSPLGIIVCKFLQAPFSMMHCALRGKPLPLPSLSCFLNFSIKCLRLLYLQIVTS